MKRKNRAIRLSGATLLVTLLASCLGLWGHATMCSSVIGLVTDSSNAANPGAEVALTDLGAKIAYGRETERGGEKVSGNRSPFSGRPPASTGAVGRRIVLTSYSFENNIRNIILQGDLVATSAAAVVRTT